MMDELREKLQHLWCQHCKALQKSNDTAVECWYKPLDEEAPAFCAANEDAIDSFLAAVVEAVKRVPLIENRFIAQDISPDIKEALVNGHDAGVRDERDNIVSFLRRTE